MTIFEQYRYLFEMDNLSDLDNDKALVNIGKLIDISYDLKKIDGLKKAVKLLKVYGKRILSDEQKCLYNYFFANAWSNLSRLLRRRTIKSWRWEQKVIEKEIILLRNALKFGRITEIPKIRLCQIYTNLGNLMDHVGRFVEAIEYWDLALEIIPDFPMAIGNKANGLTYYARSLYDQVQRAIFLKLAYDYMNEVLLHDNIYEEARVGFYKCKEWIEKVCSPSLLKEEINMNNFSLGDSDEEVKYKKWCLEKRLFLNPLNDLGNYAIAANDVISVPGIVVKIGEGPYYHGFFNQMKQEFVSARYILYEGLKSRELHFSDKDVILYNTLDYPVYSLSVEKVKFAFRVAYSLFDKIAFFLNHYLRLNIKEKKVSFKTLWYDYQQKKKVLRSDFRKKENLPLRGLFWLSKDLFENEPGFRDAIEPEAKDIYEIRNHLEHKYLKVYDDIWLGQSVDKWESADILAFHIKRKEFESKSIKLVKMVRAALIYLTLAVHIEEIERANERGKDVKVLELYLDSWNDEWKV
ncbi:MAG TPA: hypothetical protein ENI51_08595 [Candidatus Atribacteria bacterium]|nr:hypothetical protein [Candidatus Atribacteria bacterium]